MLEAFKSGKFNYKRLSLEEQKSRGILGRLTGIIADTNNPTRNGRKYSKQLWENVFNNDIMKEKIANHLVLGELGHPTDREEIDIEKAAICLAEQPKICDDGNIYGVFDILSTPSGRILKSLCDYGCNIGVSSRGSGDLYTDENGNEAVDPDTYNCECWDAVVVPAVESARMQYVTESLNVKKYSKTLKEKLSEELEKANDDDKRIMKESLDNLDIKLDEEVINEASTRAWLLRQDGSTIPQTVHTKLFSNNIEDVINSEQIQKSLRDYRDITNRYEVKQLIDKLFDHIKNGSDDLDAMQRMYDIIFDNINTEFVKVRVGGMYGDEGESEIYFRIASKHINWYEPICNFLIKHKGIADYISVLSDIEVLHKEVYKKLDGKEIKHMPVEEFLMAKGNPIVENKRVSEFEYNISKGTPIIEAYGKTNYIGHITERYDYSKDLTEDYNLNDMVEYKNIVNKNEHNLITEDTHTEDNQEDVRVDDDTIISSEEVADVVEDEIIDNKEDAEVVNDRELDAIKDDFVQPVDEMEEEMNESVEDCSDKEVEEEKEVVDDKDLSEELQEMLMKISKLEKDNLLLQEKLSVCNAKEIELNEELNKYKTCAVNLSETAKKVRPLNLKINELNESLGRKDKIITTNKARLEKLFEDKKDLNSKLDESLSNTNSLEEKVDTLTKDLENSKKSLDEKLNLITKYKKALKESKDAFISAKAENYGVEKEDVLARLNESYKLKDVDLICEELSERNYNMSKLPFNINEGVKIKTKTSKEYITGKSLHSEDDYVSDYLLNMIK